MDKNLYLPDDKSSFYYHKIWQPSKSPDHCITSDFETDFICELKKCVLSCSILLFNDGIEFDRLIQARDKKSQQSLVTKYANYC